MDWTQPNTTEILKARARAHRDELLNGYSFGNPQADELVALAMASFATVILSEQIDEILER